MGYEVIDRHVLLVYFLSQFSAYKDLDDKPVFQARKRYVRGYRPEEFTFLQIKRAADVLVDLFNLTSAVVEGKFDLYKLLHAYLLDNEMRVELNKVIGA
ncbi:MAG: hypothetical protein P4L51_06100 [Puia sp.]|nr:hypothetical protein [Puia sp.]